VRVDPAEATTDIYVGLEHLDPETLHLRQWGHPSDVTGQKLVFKKGDVIFGRRRAYQRKLAVAEFDGICSAHALVVRARPEFILPEFLPFFLQSDMFMERAIEISVGSLSPTINWKTLRVQEFLLPPIEEQKRIAEILWVADEAVEVYMLCLKEMSNLLSVLRTNTIWKNKEYLTPIGDGIDFLGGFAFKSVDFIPSGVQLVRMGNLFEGTLNLERKPVFLPQSIAEQNVRYLLTAGDILMSLTGTVGKQDYGYALEIPTDAPPLLLNQRVAKLTPKSTVNHNYLLHILSSKEFLKQVYRIAAGTKQANLLKGQLCSIKVPIPSLIEQKRILKLLSAHEAAGLLLSNHIENIKCLCKAMAEKALNGGASHV
jgi:restriction endonuclease S subunit